MKISIKDLMNGSLSRITIDSQISLNKDELGHEFYNEPLFTIKGAIFRRGDTYVMSFDYKSELEYMCERCLDISKNIMSGSVEYNLSEELEDEFGSIMIDNRTVDLSKALFDDVYIHLPTQMFCKDECQGICSSCGINLNRDECICDDDEIDPRFLKLKMLLKNEEV